MTGTLEKIPRFEDDNDRLHSGFETKAKDDQGIEALKDIAFGSVCRTISNISHRT